MNFEIFYISNHLGVDHKCDRKTDKRDVSRPKTEALAYRKVNKSAKDLRNRTQINHINSVSLHGKLYRQLRCAVAAQDRKWHLMKEKC